MSADRSAGLVLTRRLALAAAGGLLTSGLVEAAAAPIERGSPMVWPALQLLDGQLLTADAWKDRAGVVVFWATWCPYCRRHNARIEKLHQAARGKPLRVLGVAVDGDDATVRQYMTANGYSFPVLVGDAGLRERFTSRRTIPMTALVDRHGRFLQVIPGEMAEDDVLALISLATPTQAPNA